MKCGKATIEVKRKQLPVGIGYGKTLDWAQGGTYEGKVAINMFHPPFTHGQLYMALMRATDIANITIIIRKGWTYAQNVVNKFIFPKKKN